MPNEVCFRTLHLKDPWTLKSYESVGGYSISAENFKRKNPAGTNCANAKRFCLARAWRRWISDRIKMELCRA